MFFNTYGVLINDKVVGKVSAMNMDEAFEIAASRYGKTNLKVHLWGRA